MGNTEVFQPGILRALDQDRELTLHAGDQLVNTRYIPVKTASEAHEVAKILPEESRLPLALIHVRSADTWKLAEELSRKLLGLVRAVTLNFETTRLLANAHPEATVPFGGFTMVWPGMIAPPLVYSADRLSEIGVQEVLRSLTRRLGALAALSSGEDASWRQATTAADNARMNEHLEQAEQARQGGDLEGEITALKKQINTLKTAKEDLEAIGEEALEQADVSARIASVLESERDNAREQAEIWQKSYLDLASGKLVEEPGPQDVWAAIPPLATGSDPEATFLAISDAASDRIVFTKRAMRSWTGIDYPDPEDMTEKLVSLARAAAVLYDGEDRSYPHLDEWFKEGYGLTVALTDQTISKWKRKEMRWLNAFPHDGGTLDATPHVKVRDAVKMNECGRIHFALEPSKNRLVVQHVGIKTYE